MGSPFPAEFPRLPRTGNGGTKILTSTPGCLRGFALDSFLTHQPNRFPKTFCSYQSSTPVKA